MHGYGIVMTAMGLFPPILFTPGGGPPGNSVPPGPRHTAAVTVLRRTRPGYTPAHDFEVDYRRVTHRLEGILEQERRRVARAVRTATPSL